MPPRNRKVFGPCWMCSLKTDRKNVIMDKFMCEECAMDAHDAIGHVFGSDTIPEEERLARARAFEERKRRGALQAKERNA